MVIRSSFAALLLFLASAAAAITADELRGAAAEKDSEAAQRKERANTGALGSLLPQSGKYSTPARPAPATGTPTAKSTAKSRKSAPAKPAAASSVPDANIYVPPERAVAAGTSIVTDAVQERVSFGIRLGSWLDASLDRDTTSADSGTVELTLSSDYAGDRRTLPAGTTLFAEKSLNAATKRLEMVVTHGITPSGQEFEMRGICFDPRKTPGLAGVYVIDKKAVASHGLAKGAIAAVGAAAGAATPGVGGQAANAATQSVLSDANQVTDSNAQQAIIYVSPQPLIIRVEKQF